MFAVIYQCYVKEGREQEYCKVWNLIACYFKEKRGALGSCLHKTSDNLWVAYSRWPDQKTRDASWPSENVLQENVLQDQMPEEMIKNIRALKDCIDDTRKIPEIRMEVIDNYFL